VNVVLPKKIWSYWHDTNIPTDIQMTLAHRKQVLDTYEHIMLHENTIRDYIKTPIPVQFNKLSQAHKADWVRLALLKEHGGIWMDSGIIVNSKKAVDTLYASAKGTELSAFYLEERTIHNQPSSYIENWCLIAKKGSPLVVKWLKEYERAIDMGFESYHQQVAYTIPKNDRFGTYLTQHACMQVILQQYAVMPNIRLFRADDTMFKLQIECNWDSTCVMNRILTDKTVKSRIPYIKLRGSERETNINIASYFNLKK